MIESRPKQLRPSKEFWDLVNFIRAHYLLQGKTPPTISAITKLIAERIDKEEILRNEII